MSEKWYRQIGNNSDTVISTRIRLARNLASYPFPNRMTPEQCREVSDMVCDAASQLTGLPLRYVDLSQCAEREVLSMVERHLISVDLARRPSGGVLISEDERISIMINEEDHIRIQVMSAGFDLEEAYQLADRVDTALDERLHFAFDDRLGYLTQCPTNLGTGMRASLMLHLPALQERGAVQQLAGTVSKLGLTVRGAYGEGTQPHGALYQMSNQVTLGISESAAIENLKGIALQIMQQEQALREQMVAKPTCEDLVWRSLGILKSARLLTNEEALKLLSNVRMGICIGILEGVTLDTVTELMSDIHPGCLMVRAEEDLALEMRDRQRATLVRTALN